METHTDRVARQSAAADSLALYVHLHPSYFGLLVFDTDGNRIERMETAVGYPSEAGQRDDHADSIDAGRLQSWLTEMSEILNMPYGTIRVCVSTSKFNIVNEAALADEAAFRLVNSIEPDSHVLRTERIREDLFVQFAISDRIDRLLCSHFEPSDIHFGERGLLLLLASESDLYPDGVYCQLLGQEATVLVLQENRLVFFNKYRVKDREDLLYYLLLCYQGHELDPDADPLRISGLLDEDSPMYELVYDYIRNVSFLELPAPARFSDPSAHPEPGHYFINLMSIR